ncbi:unnamed protein product [Lactuca saligna]|uniref:GH18 domain-containing protein n=1 Tax=Lactuca saligna TaxID=75948 RepID=A0AA35ZT73_LACSI|nr:unnamed protein product [Lactuca saligna]
MGWNWRLKVGFQLCFMISFLSLTSPFHLLMAANSNLFREYIGAESDSVKLSDVPINSKVEVHFILAFAIDYTSDNHPSPTNGKFNVFWETKNLGPSAIASVKAKNSNVKVAVSLGGDSVVHDKNKVFFSPKSINSWVQNAVSSLTSMIKQYNLDGIDIDYEHFRSHDEETFVECIGRLIIILKKNRIIKFASIAPYEDEGPVQRNYLALWRKYGHVIDYVNFQFYAYDQISVSQFVKHFHHQQASSYKGSQLLASFISKGNLGLPPNKGFFEACKELKRDGKLGGIFVWCADESKEFGFRYEKAALALLAA